MAVLRKPVEKRMALYVRLYRDDENGGDSKQRDMEIPCPAVFLYRVVFPKLSPRKSVEVRSCTNRRSARIGEKIFGLARKRRAGILTDFKRF